MANNEYISGMEIYIIYCLDDYELEIKRSVFDQDLFFYQMNFEMYACSNETSNSCKSQNEIQSFLQDIYFGFYYQDFIFDFNNYEIPLKAFPGAEKIFIISS